MSLFKFESYIENHLGSYRAIVFLINNKDVARMESDWVTKTEAKEIENSFIEFMNNLSELDVDRQFKIMRSIIRNM